MSKFGSRERYFRPDKLRHLVAYRPDFFRRHEDIETCIAMVNAEECGMVQAIDVTRITTSWVHSILSHVWALQSSTDMIFVSNF